MPNVFDDTNNIYKEVLDSKFTNKYIIALHEAFNVESKYSDMENIHLLIPFNALKNGLNFSPVALLHELRQKFIDDTEKINVYVDNTFNEAINHYVQKHNEKEMESQKPVQNGPGRRK